MRSLRSDFIGAVPNQTAIDEQINRITIEALHLGPADKTPQPEAARTGLIILGGERERARLIPQIEQIFERRMPMVSLEFEYVPSIERSPSGKRLEFMQLAIPAVLIDPVSQQPVLRGTYNGETVVNANHDGSVARAVATGPPAGASVVPQPTAATNDIYDSYVLASLWEQS